MTDARTRARDRVDIGVGGIEAVGDPGLIESGAEGGSPGVEEGSDDPPPARRHAAQPMKPAAPREVEQNRFGSIIGGVRGGDERLGAKLIGDLLEESRSGRSGPPLRSQCHRSRREPRHRSGAAARAARGHRPHRSRTPRLRPIGSEAVVEVGHDQLPVRRSAATGRPRRGAMPWSRGHPTPPARGERRCRSRPDRRLRPASGQGGDRRGWVVAEGGFEPPTKGL